MIRLAIIGALLVFGAKLAFAVADFAQAREAQRVYIMQQAGAQ
jgi:hypothetical protein